MMLSALFCYFPTKFYPSVALGWNLKLNTWRKEPQSTMKEGMTLTGTVRFDLSTRSPWRCAKHLFQRCVPWYNQLSALQKSFFISLRMVNVSRFVLIICPDLGVGVITKRHVPGSKIGNLRSLPNRISRTCETDSLVPKWATLATLRASEANALQPVWVRQPANCLARSNL